MINCPDCVIPASGGFFSNLFSTDFIPRAQCVGDRPEVVWLHVVSDAVITLSYYSIPLALGYFVLKRRHVAFDWMFKLFALFILACGTTHLLNIAAFWYPMYRLDGVVKALTGAISLVTAFSLWPLIPRALALPRPSELQEANRRLQDEITVRISVEQRLEESHEGLEAAVKERTAKLAELNLAMAARVAEMESVYKGAPIGLCLLDENSRVVRLNELLAEMFGGDAGSHVGRRILDISPAVGRVVDAIWRPTSGQVIDPVVRLSDTKGSGMETIWLVAVQPVLERGETSGGVCVAVKDISEPTRLQEQVHQIQKMEAVGLLASGIAHDINNTLTAIYGYLSLALVTLDKSHAASPYIEKIAIAAEQASQTTKSLLTFARPVPPRREPVELAPIVQQAMSMARGLMPATILTVMDLRDAEGVWVQGDPTQLQQACLNLAINARDAMPEGGQFSMRLEQASDEVRIVVQDTGKGMTLEVQARMFEPFFTTKPRGEGTGLGLSVVQGIVRSHNGKITVRSAENSGTTFTIELPTIVPPGARAAEARPSAPKSGEGLVVLVEDNSHVRDLLGMALRASGFKVEEIGDGEAFLARAGEVGAVAYVLDIDIPGRLGTECLTIRRAKGDRTPAVFISGGRADDVITDAFTKTLSKPFHPSDLVRAVNAAIASANQALESGG